jgi:hypothetical protein
MQTQKLLKKLETNITTKNITKFSNKKDVINLVSKLNKLNADKLISEAIDLGNNNYYNNITKEKYIDFLWEIENNAISNYLGYLSQKNIKELKELFIKEIENFKIKANLEINKKDRELNEYKSKCELISEENNLLNKKLLDFNNRFICLQKLFKDKEEEIIQIKEKLQFYKENEKLITLFSDNFYDKDPIDIIKSYKEKHEGEINLMHEKEDLKSTIKNLEKKMKEENDENKKNISILKDKIDGLKLENNELLENHTDKIGEIIFLNKSNKKLQEKNHLLHKMLYQLYNKLFEAFRLNKNININDKYLNITEEDFLPNVYDDEELCRYIKIMISTSIPSLSDKLLRETVANANMIFRMFLRNNINLNLRFDPIITFRELKLFMENREDKIKNLENLVKKYQEMLSSSENSEKKFENMVRAMEQEKIIKRESYIESGKSFFIKKNSLLNNYSNNIITNVNNEITNMTNTNIISEGNKSIKDKINFLTLSKEYLPTKGFELTSTKNNTNENKNNNATNMDNIFKIRPKSSSPRITKYKKIEYNKKRIMSTNNAKNNIKNKKYYKETKYQLLHCLSVVNKNENSFNDTYYKKLRKITIGKRGNILKENGSQKFVNYYKNVKQLVNHTNKLFLYRSRLSPYKYYNSFSLKLKSPKNKIRVISKEKEYYGKKIKNEIIHKIDKLINELDINTEKSENKNKDNNPEKIKNKKT